SFAGQANQEFFFIRIKAKPNKNTKIKTYIRITSLVVTSGHSSICSSSINYDYKINNPYSVKDTVDISIKKTMCHLSPTTRQITHPLRYSLKAMQSTLPSRSFSGFMPPHPKMGSNHDPPTLTVLPPHSPQQLRQKNTLFQALAQRNVT